ncbi:hypothetical protein JTE90_013490 [Oedothorax gibbosus]|uniref:Uncharacterized protein n=1 Tax=Oedothorax gibbosus TaxID=931172 RepID=A0AAV6VN85_9ARAC|nr:hypothetical protein JTE90_013490 [Oedothorax gibbosus]
MACFCGFIINLFNWCFKRPSSKPKVRQENAELLNDGTEETGTAHSPQLGEIPNCSDAPFSADTKEVPIPRDPILTEVEETIQTTIDILEAVEDLVEAVTHDFKSRRT